ncbi:MAG: glycosyltransferase family 39 protein [Planctomycetes bacterium]|nr:glycosyltransferase family 39 protein [Planctomycetota bacterium]
MTRRARNRARILRFFSVRREQREVGPIGKPLEFMPDAGSRPTSLNRIDVIALASAFLVGLALRLHSPNPESVWLDEANSVLIAVRPLPELIDALTRDGNPPLYYILLHFWVKLFGEGEVALRTLSAILGALLAPGVYVVARRSFGRAAAVVGATLAVAWPLHIYYSQQIRMYSVLPLVGLAFVAALLRALERGDASKWRAWALVVVAALATIWTHNYGMFLVAAAPVAWLVRGPRTQRTATRVALAMVAIGVIDLVWFPVVLRQASSGVGSWIPANSLMVEQAAPLHSLPLYSLLVFGAGYDYPFYLQALGGTSKVAPVALAWLAIVVAGSAFVVAGDRSIRTKCLALLILALAPIVVPYAISSFSTSIYLVGRYEMVAYPAFVLIVAAGGESAWRRWGTGRAATVIVLLAYVGLAAATLCRYWERIPPRFDEKMAGVIASRASDGDVVLTTGLARAPVEYYLRRLGWSERLRIESFPHSVGDHLGWIDRTEFVAADLGREAGDVVTGLAGFRGTVFLAGQGGVDTKVLMDQLDAHATSGQELLRNETYGLVEYRFAR